MSGDMPDLPAMPEDGDPKGLRAWATKVSEQNASLRDAGNQVAAELNTMKRDRAFSEAKIPADGLWSLFREKYDGELDAASIAKVAAESYGFTVEQPPAEQPGTPTQDPQPAADPLEQERQSMASNSQVTAQYAQPATEQTSALQEALLKAGTREERYRILGEAGMLAESD